MTGPLRPPPRSERRWSTSPALSPDQRRAVCAPDDAPLLIDACPGSGKTRLLTHRAAWLVRARGVEPWELLLLSFTNQAVAELRARLGPLLGRRARSCRSPRSTPSAAGWPSTSSWPAARSPSTTCSTSRWPRSTGATRCGPSCTAPSATCWSMSSQDVDARQAALIRHLVAPPAGLTAVGDGDQRIYGLLTGALGLGWVPRLFPDARRRPADRELPLGGRHRPAGQRRDGPRRPPLPAARPAPDHLPGERRGRRGRLHRPRDRAAPPGRRHPRRRRGGGAGPAAGAGPPDLARPRAGGGCRSAPASSGRRPIGPPTTAWS